MPCGTYSYCESSYVRYFPDTDTNEQAYQRGYDQAYRGPREVDSSLSSQKRKMQREVNKENKRLKTIAEEIVRLNPEILNEKTEQAHMLRKYLGD